MTGSYNRECIIGNVSRKCNIFIAQSGVDEVIVMRRKEQTSRNAFRDPLLVKHQAVVVRDPQVEQRRLARHNKIKSVFGSRLFKG